MHTRKMHHTWRVNKVFDNSHVKTKVISHVEMHHSLESLSLDQQGNFEMCAKMDVG